MAVSFIVVPQWQGSGSPRRRELADGAAAIRAALPSAAVHDVAVPDQPGEARDGVHGHSVLHQICRDHARVRAEIEGAAITIGGDCGVDLPAVADAARRAADDLAVVWFDAHCDLNSPAVSPSGRFHGMVLRAVVGEGAPGLVAEPGAAVPPTRVVLAGTRVFDAAERDYIAARGVQVVPAAQLTPEAVVAAVAATRASSVFLHVDVDILDPGELRGICYPVSDGVSVATLVASIAALRARFRFAGGGLTEFAPRSPAEAAHDLPIVQRILGALAG